MAKYRSTTALRRLCMPADFDTASLHAYVRLSQSYPEFTVCETYGNLNPSPFGSGRARGSALLPQVGMPELREYVTASRKLGIDFNYTLNAACMAGREFTARGLDQILGFVQRLMDAGVNTFTITIPSLVPVIKAHFPSTRLCSSLICEIDSVPAARMFSRLGYDRLIIDDSIIRRFDIIRAIRRSVDVPLETLVNNACLFNCPWKAAHYNLLAHGAPQQGNDLELYYHWQCMAVRCSEPAELLRLRWIRPEDVRLYSDICYFKVVGRYFARQSDLLRVARAYASGRFEGNLWDLLGNFAPQRRHGFKIANQALQGFVDYFRKFPRACSDLACNGCNHCRSFAEKAVDAASFDAARERLDLPGLQARVERLCRYGQNPHLSVDEVFCTVMETNL